MVELVESAAERKERKRLKKLKKQEKAASDDSAISSDVDSTSKLLASVETPEQKKERKRLKKLAKKKLEEAVAAAVPAAEEKSKKKKKKKEKKLESNGNGTVVPDENSNNVKKSAKKRKNEDGVKEEQMVPFNAWTKIMQNTGNNEQPPAKKPKQKESKAKVDIPEEKETGVFKKIFYRPTESTINMTDDEVNAFRTENKMNLTGDNVSHYKPILEFSDFCQDAKIMSVTKGFSKPTPIQAQCWPIIASGRDIIGIAETGSGKTLSFSLPALAHMLYRYDHPVPAVPKSPMMLVLSPTRELAMQTQTVMEEAGKACFIRYHIFD